MLLGDPACPTVTHFISREWEIQCVPSPDMLATAHREQGDVSLMAAIGLRASCALTPEYLPDVLKTARAVLASGGHLVLRSRGERRSGIVPLMRAHGFCAAWNAAPVFIDDPIDPLAGTLQIARQN